MALEWGPLGIRANAVAPGLIDAGMSEPIYADPEIRRRRSERVPMGRLGTGADVAAVVLFLLSPAAGYVNGTEILVDGGVTMSVITTLPRPKDVDAVGPNDDERSATQRVTRNLLLSGGPGHDFDAAAEAISHLLRDEGIDTESSTSPPDAGPPRSPGRPPPTRRTTCSPCTPSTGA